MLKVTLTSEKPIVAVVDDEQEITELLVEELSSNYHVMPFNSPQKFLTAMKDGIFQPAVIVTDLKMPRMSGIEMLRELKAMGQKSPAILFSGYLEKDDAIKALELGVVHVLEKPVDVARVHDIVDATYVDYELMRNHEEIKSLIQELSEIYSTLRVSISNYVPRDIVDKIFLGPNESGAQKMAFEEVLERLESKLDSLIKEEDVLTRIKDKQVTRSA